MRRSFVFVLVVLVALVVAGAVLAATIQCPPGGCYGTNHDDRILGTDQQDNIQGFRGDDVVKGFGGDDNTLRGDEGSDTVLGGAGFDFVEGGPGRDDVRGGSGGDAYFYSQSWGREKIVDTPILDTNLDTGNFVRLDFVTADLRIDLNSGDGPEVKNRRRTMTLNWADDLIDGVVDGGGDDLIIGRGVGDKISLFNGPGDADTVRAGDGDDHVYDGDGDGNDVIKCGPGNDLVEGESAGDTLIDCES